MRASNKSDGINELYVLYFVMLGDEQHRLVPVRFNEQGLFFLSVSNISFSKPICFTGCLVADGDVTPFNALRLL